MEKLFDIDKKKYPMVGNEQWMYWGDKSKGTIGRAFTKQEYFNRYRKHNHEIVNTIVSFYKPNRVLSLGCGIGFDVERFVQLGIDITGLEITQDAITNSSVSEKIVWGSATDLSRFSDRSFDLVLALELLEHLPPELTEQAISEIKRVGCKYGILTIGRGSQDPTHINLRPREEWIELLAPMDNLLQQKIGDSLKAKRLVDMVWDRVYVMRLDNESNNISGRYGVTDGN